MNLSTLTPDAQRRAIMARDARYDSLFYFAVTTTGIYCLPSCPAPRPRPENVRFFWTVADAKGAGFRACKRCKPDDMPRTTQHARLAAIQADVALDAIAAEQKISPRQLRRTVKAETGVGPAKLRQASRLQQARALIADTALPITDIAFQAGFTSLRQFNRAFKEAFSITPSAHRQESSRARAMLTVTSVDTPVGQFHLVIDDKTVIASGFGGLAELIQRLPADLRTAPRHIAVGHPYAHLVEEYFAGTITALDAIPYRQSGSEFQRSVWNAMEAIKPGTTWTYAQLAAAAGNGQAIRAAGTACGQNRLILLVPCHRVVKSDGGIGNYLYGAPIKEYLLQHEATYQKLPRRA